MTEAFGHLDLDWRDHVELDPKYLRPAEVDLLIGDAGKAKRELGWQPEVTFSGLVQLMVAADVTLAGQDQHEAFGDTNSNGVISSARTN